MATVLRWIPILDLLARTGMHGVAGMLRVGSNLKPLATGTLASEAVDLDVEVVVHGRLLRVEPSALSEVRVTTETVDVERQGEADDQDARGDLARPRAEWMCGVEWVSTWVRGRRSVSTHVEPLHDGCLGGATVLLEFVRSGEVKLCSSNSLRMRSWKLR